MSRYSKFSVSILALSLAIIQGASAAPQAQPQTQKTQPGSALTAQQRSELVVAHKALKEWLDEHKQMVAATKEIKKGQTVDEDEKAIVAFLSDMYVGLGPVLTKVTQVVNQKSSPKDLFKKDGANLLFLAVAGERKDLVEIFLKYGAPVNHVFGKNEEDAGTLLDLAEEEGDEPMIKLLKRYGAKTKDVKPEDSEDS